MKGNDITGNISLIRSFPIIFFSLSNTFGISVHFLPNLLKYSILLRLRLLAYNAPSNRPFYF